MPSPVDALPCGSRSTIRTFSPTAASAVPRLIAVVVLPTPPFWLEMDRTRKPGCGRGSDTRKPPDLDDATARMTEARRQRRLEFPISCGFGNFNVNILTFKE